MNKLELNLNTLIIWNQLKETVVSVSLSKDVQKKLRRGSLRKKYFLPRKADVSQSTLRYASYTVKKISRMLLYVPSMRPLSLNFLG